MGKQVLLIVNPNAGNGKLQKKVPKIKQNFRAQGYNVDIVYTKKNLSAKHIVKDYDKKLDIVICLGGDGTVNDLINAVMQLENRPQISFIPLGTVNDFAKTIGLAEKKFFSKNAFENTIQKPADVGKFDQKYFNYVAAFGAFSAVSYVTKQKLKRYLGKLAYFLVGIRYLFKIKSYDVKINIDGEIINQKCIYGSVSNSKSIGGFKWFRKKDISINDGKFEILLIKKPKHKSEYIGIVFSILSRRYNSKNFLYKQGSNIEIESENCLSWTIDGEFGGRTKKTSIINYKEAVTFIVPK